MGTIVFLFIQRECARWGEIVELVVREAKERLKTKMGSGAMRAGYVDKWLSLPEIVSKVVSTLSLE